MKIPVEELPETQCPCPGYRASPTCLTISVMSAISQKYCHGMSKHTVMDTTETKTGFIIKHEVQQCI